MTKRSNHGPAAAKDATNSLARARQQRLAWAMIGGLKSRQHARQVDRLTKAAS